MMLFKLSLGNVRRSLRDYTIYYLTLLIGVAVFYVFNAIESQAAFLHISESTRQIVVLMMNVLSGVSVFVSCVLGGLIVYANRFLMRRRKKEFALYMTLGMSKGKVSAILLTETLMIGILSLVSGLLAGIGLSQLMSALVVKMFDADMTSYQFVFSAPAAVKTLIYFGLIYVVTMIFNAGAVGRFKLIDLMSSDKKAEVQKMKKPVVCVIVFLAAAVMLGYAYYKVAFDFGSIEDEWIMLVYIAMGGTATFMIFWSVSGMLTRLVMSSKRSYYRGLNCFTYRQIGSRINTMVISAGVICLMLFVTICTFASAFSLKSSLENSINRNAPADINILISDVSENTPQDVVSVMRSAGIDPDEYLSEYVVVHEYTSGEINGDAFFGDYMEEAGKEMEHLFIGGVAEEMMYVSEYNRLAGIYGLEQLTVGDDEYAVAGNFAETIRARNIPLSHGHELTIAGRTLKPAYSECRLGFDMISNTDINTGIIIIPDSLTFGENDLARKATLLAGNYKAKSKADKRSTDSLFLNARDRIDTVLSENADPDGRSAVYIMNTRLDLTDSAVGLGAFATFIGLYIGIVFLISCGAILSIKALSENIDSIPRYDILRKIGADEKDIDRSLFRQTGIFFLLPLLLAGIHTIFGMKFALNVLGVFVTTDEMLPGMLLTAAIVAAIYGGYFLITYFCGKNIIKSKM